MFDGGYVAKEDDVVENKAPGNTTSVDLQTLLETFLNVSLRSAGFIDGDVFFFFLEGKIFSFGTTLKIVRISELLGAELNKFYCICY